MKLMYSEARRKFDNIDYPVLDKIPGKTISLGATVQYLPLLESVKDYLEKKGKKVIVKEGAFYKGQITGCKSIALDNSADNILIICDGKFHALNNALDIEKEIYIFDGKSIEKISQEELNRLKNKKKAAISKFLSSETIGLILSTKQGQYYNNITLLKEKIENKGKKCFIFETDLINVNELENFKIDFWVNTACPGIFLDSSKLVNVKDIEKFL